MSDDNENNVVSLDSARPHMRGPAKCLNCDHEWEAVDLVGSQILECPECGLDKGIWAALNLPKEGDLVWTCNGCDGIYFFRVSGEGWMCATCGLTQEGVHDD